MFFLIHGLVVVKVLYITDYILSLSFPSEMTSTKKVKKKCRVEGCQRDLRSEESFIPIFLSLPQYVVFTAADVYLERNTRTLCLTYVLLYTFSSSLSSSFQRMPARLPLMDNDSFCYKEKSKVS